MPAPFFMRNNILRWREREKEGKEDVEKRRKKKEARHPGKISSANLIRDLIY